MAFNSGPLLHFADLPSALVNYIRARSIGGMATAAVAGGEPVRSGWPETVVPLHELERRAIRHAIEHTHGDRTVAAQLLGIGRTTLYRKLKEYRME